MDAEFINVYIGKQKALIDDLQTRVLLADTKCSILEQQLIDANNKLAKLAESKKSSTKGSSNE